MSEEQIHRDERIPGEREARTEHVDTKEIDNRLEDIEKELETLDVEPVVTQPRAVMKPVVKEDPYQLFVKQVPDWTKKPFMYIITKNEKMRESWLQKWGDLVLLYSRTTISHIVAIEQLRQLEPFRNSSNGKTLSLEQMQILIDYLVAKELAKWLDDAKLRARIYYKTLEEFADMLLKYVLDRGLDTEYLITKTEFRNFGQEWSSLPDEDLDEVFRILEKRRKIKPMDRERDSFSFDV